MKKQLLILMTLFITTIGYSQTFVQNSITYNVTSTSPNTVEITNYDINGGTVVTIPEMITDNSITYSVTSIGFAAFQSKNLTNVFIPSSVEIIENQAFAVNDLTNVTLSNGLTTIGGSAFRNNDIASITIPSSVTDIQFAAFRDNPLLTSVTSEAINPATVVTGGLNDSFYIRSAIDLTIPNGTSATYASSGWTGFNTVTEVSPLAVGDTFVVDYITYEVTSLTPNTVEAIDYDINGGTIVIIPDTVSNNSIPFSVTSIGSLAFHFKQLTSVTFIGNSVTIINIGAFMQNSLTSIVIPDSVTFIGNLSFKTNQITSVVIPSNAIPGHESFKDNAINTLTIENGVTSIAPNAFENNQLSSLTIPDSITFIGPNAFAGNPLTNVFSEATLPPTITTGTDDTFAADRSTIHLHIPPGTTAAYVTDAGALWTGFNPVTEDALSITDFELGNAIKIITTPDDIRISISNNAVLKGYTLYNIIGSKVTEGVEYRIATTSFNSGVYLLKLDFDKGTVVKKIVIN